MKAHRLKDLVVWQKSILLAKKVYTLTVDLPLNERYGLVSQIRRSAISIPSNIAEGAGRNNKSEFIQFLGIASGSCYELETQLILLSELKYKSEDEIRESLNALFEIQKMIYKLKEHLKKSYY
ncbi:four helix bundle protein [Bergeyella zoohelcum]|uniref:Four helix bundle protein n=1 Tax=Bergeyella zoohelcum TaxID=1015 RepID=A0A376C012_9FLAO|nr:four helix bundle protein [Bergeyella zoohelcum]EKB57091.1 hypothetical protein HMPREF9700_02308 [Bergeyella zoohelcum CCUG 30536]SSZ55553.1 four helix bundle protein [Bergeyella zoohelcum]VDH04535.1 four helix bundle protein [Bergeyella zoohelcum]